MKLTPSMTDTVITPAFILNENTLLDALAKSHTIKQHSGVSVIYTLKPLTNADLMRKMVSNQIDGFAASSLFETKLAREILGNKGTIHVTSPGLRMDEIEEIGQLCDYISFNSLSQYHHLKNSIPEKVQIGLRINPRLSYVKDERYDPCHKNSKLGVPINEILLLQPELLDRINGIHFHSNCESSTFIPLLETVQELRMKLHPLLKKIQWINLGGGYYFEDETNYDPLFQAIDILRSEYALKVFIEPGAALVDESGCIVSSVIDTFTYAESDFAVLDTTINHMPEVYEYQFRPTIAHEVIGGQYSISLVGSSCLAGDFFGEYSFDAPLKIGSRVVFLKCGAYTHVKAHMFNGINLPTQYMITEAGKLELKKRYTYQDFLSRCGGCI